MVVVIVVVGFLCGYSAFIVYVNQPVVGYPRTRIIPARAFAPKLGSKPLRKAPSSSQV